MEKALLNSFISKYSLGGTIEAVVWEIGEDNLKTKIVSDTKDLLGEVELKSKVFDNVDGKKIGIFTTSKLVKMLTVLDDDITLTLESAGDHPKALKLSDSGTAKESYALADLSIIPTVPPLKAENMPKEYEVSIKIDEKFAESFTKAKAALPEIIVFTFHATAKKVEFIFGQTDVNTNVIYLTPNATETSAMDKMTFSANAFKEILTANRGVKADFLVSSKGLGKLVFDTKEYKATYYLVQKS